MPTLAHIYMHWHTRMRAHAAPGALPPGEHEAGSGDVEAHAMAALRSLATLTGSDSPDPTEQELNQIMDMQGCAGLGDARAACTLGCFCMGGQGGAPLGGPRACGCMSWQARLCVQMPACGRKRGWARGAHASAPAAPSRHSPPHRSYRLYDAYGLMPLLSGLMMEGGGADGPGAGSSSGGSSITAGQLMSLIKASKVCAWVVVWLGCPPLPPLPLSLRV